MTDELTDYGFIWGPMEVTRIAVIGRRGYVLQIKTGTQKLEIYVSEKGRSVRAFKGAKELT